MPTGHHPVPGPADRARPTSSPALLDGRSSSRAPNTHPRRDARGQHGQPRDLSTSRQVPKEILSWLTVVARYRPAAPSRAPRPAHIRARGLCEVRSASRQACAVGWQCSANQPGRPSRVAPPVTTRTAPSEPHDGRSCLETRPRSSSTRCRRPGRGHLELRPRQDCTTVRADGR